MGRIITIARGMGSGGKTIGKMLAKELDIPYYDKEIIRMASDESGINEELFGRVDEKVKNTIFNREEIYDGELLGFHLRPQSVQLHRKDNNRYCRQRKICRDSRQMCGLCVKRSQGCCKAVHLFRYRNRHQKCLRQIRT